MKSYKKKYNWVLNLIKKLRLFLRQDKDFKWALDQFDLGWKIQLVLAIFTVLGIVLGKSTIQAFLLGIGWGLAFLLALFLLRKLAQKLKSTPKDLFSIKLASMLPEDLQAILEDMQKRWIKKQYLPQKIRYLTLLYLFDMLLGYIKSQITNILLPKSVSTKEIE
jgi:hypothetical protein